MTNALIELTNSLSQRWLTWILTSMLDTAVVLAVAAALWCAVRRRVAPQFGYCLFLLVPLKLVLPVPVAVPAVLAAWTPAAVVSTWLATGHDRESPAIGVARETPESTSSQLLPVLHEAPFEQRPDEATTWESPTNRYEDPDVSSEPREVLSQPGIETTSRQASRDSKTVPTFSGTPLSMAATAMLGWLFVMAMLAVRLVRAQHRFRRGLRTLQSVDEASLSVDFAEVRHRAGVRYQVRVIESDDVTTPAVWGITRPTIILPRGIAAFLSPQQLEWVLLHELAHIRRCDLLVVVIQRIAAVVHFFNPSLWLANRMIHRLREYACDDLAVSLGNGSVVDPGEAFLLILRQASRGGGQLNGTLGVFGLDSRAACFERVHRLLDAGRPIQTRLDRWSTCGLILLAAMALPRVYAAQNDDEPAAAAKVPAAASTPAAAHETDPAAKVELAVDVGEFELLVVGPDREPIAEATVEIRTNPAPAAEQILRGKYLRKGNYGSFITTDLDGRLVIKAPFNPQQFEVSVNTAGFGPYWAGWSSENHSQPIPATFTAELEAGWSIGGIVVDAEGKPVAGVKIRPNVDFKKRPGDPSQLGIGTSLQTDAAGRWQFDSVPVSKDEVFVEFSHPDFMPLHRSLAHRDFVRDPGKDLVNTIELDRGLTVVGTVADEAGNPVAGASIRTKFSNDIRETLTATDGTYNLRGCAPLIAKIVVSAKGRATDMKEVRISSEMDPVDFEMKPGGHVRIRVLDQNGQPAPRARIFFQQWRGQSFSYFEFDHVDQYADELGVWEWNEAPLDEFKADIGSASGMQLTNQTLFAREEEYVFRAPSALVVIGAVVDAETKLPLKTFKVIPGSRRDKEDLFWNHKEQFIATDGRFRVVQTDGHRGYVFRVEASGYRVAVSREIKFDEGAATIELKLIKAADLVPVVYTPDGVAAVGARIAVGIPGTQIHIKNGEISPISTYCAIETTDESGQFRIVRQENAFQLVVVHPAGFAWIKATPNETLSRIDLQGWARGEGTFRIGKEPAASVPLTIETVGPATYGKNVPHIFTGHETVTDPEGHYVFERVFPGDGRIGRYIMMMVVQGAQEITSTCMVPVHFESAGTTRIDFGVKGRPIVAMVQSADPKAKIDWRQKLVQLEPFVAELPPLEPPQIPADVAADAARRADWLLKWQQTDAGKAWNAWKVANDANERQRKSQPYYRASINLDGSIRIDDVPAGNYSLKLLFGGKVHHFSVPPMAAGQSDEPLDLGMLVLEK